MTFPFYKQPDSMDCGPTCLKMISKFYGKTFALETLRGKMQVGRSGTKLAGISEAAESIGFRTQAVKVSFGALLSTKLPAILHWNQNHYVVLYKVSKQPALFAKADASREVMHIADPAKGLMRFSANEFRRSWLSNKENGVPTGVALVIEPSPLFYENEDEVEKNSAGFTFKRLVKYLVPYKKLVLQLFIGLAIASILQLILPFLTQSVVDVGINTSNLQFIYIILLAQLALFAGRLVVDFVRSWILLHIGTRINISILTDFLIKLMKLPVSFFDSKKTGDIMQRMNDHQRIQNFITGTSVNMVFSMTNLIIFSIVLALFNTNIFVVFLLASILYSSWVLIFLKKRKQLDYKRFEVASRQQSTTIQIIQGMQETKLNGAERYMRWNWERLQARLFRLSMKNLLLNQWQQAGAFFINEGKNILITFLSAKAVINGEMTLGTMLAVQYIIGQLNSPIEQMVSFIQNWQNAKISMDRLSEIHTLEDEEPADKHFLHELPLAFSRSLQGGKATEEFNGEATILNKNGNGHAFMDDLPAREEKEAAIMFHNVSFTYPGTDNEPVLRDINLKIQKGKTTAIVGTSGSGKTTLLKLLLKFYEPQKGEIKLAGTSLSNLSHKTWRSYCGAVMQESFIFSDTVARNIAVGTDQVDMDRLYYAINVANINDFIESLPLGFNTKIGAEGVGISMGQRQRILIARAVYRNPDFIFLDEATNSLDANNESKIVSNLESFWKNKTVVIVAHRLSTVKHADYIVVLNKGVIAERGTHRELTSLKGEYFTLVKNQLELGE
jgi:ATP-binding cassette subfamily B protein